MLPHEFVPRSVGGVQRRMGGNDTSSKSMDCVRYPFHALLCPSMGGETSSSLRCIAPDGRKFFCWDGASLPRRCRPKSGAHYFVTKPPSQITEHWARLLGPSFGPLKGLGYWVTSLLAGEAKIAFLPRKKGGSVGTFGSLGTWGRCFGFLGGIGYLGTAR